MRDCWGDLVRTADFKSVFKSFFGVVAPSILTAMNRAEHLTDPIMQLMMNAGDQNGLEAWRLLVRSEQPVSGANRIASMQSILQFKFSPGFDKLEEELRTFEGLVKTYQAIFAQAVIKSQVPGDIRTHLGLQTFTRTADLVNLMSSLSKMRTAATSSISAGRTWSDADGKRLGQGQRSGQEQEQGERKRQE